MAKNFFCPRSNLKKRRGRKMSLVVEGEEEGGITMKVTTILSNNYSSTTRCRSGSGRIRNFFLPDPEF
jgi:hypothetical protein